MESELIVQAHSALAGGDWRGARRAFEAALAEAQSPEAMEGLSQALWWEGDEDNALALRHRAHNAYRRRGDQVRAVRCALWVADEYLKVYGDRAAANGWLKRAERLLIDDSARPALGWLALARASRSDEPEVAERYAQEALAEAELWSDNELEAYGLAQVGLARVARGDVKPGLSDLDEAMAIATSLENVNAAGDVACSLMQAAELIGDLSPFQSWAAVIERYMLHHGHRTLISSCGTCCGQVFAANGDWASAETELLRTIAALEQSGHRSRCSHPSAALASLRVLQGRLEEAEAIIAPYANMPESVTPTAELLIARNHLLPASRLLERRLTRIGHGNLAAVPILSLLAQVQAAMGHREAAALSANHLAALAEKSGLERVRGLAELASARASADPTTALPHYERAIDAFEAARVPIEAAIARVELARLIRETDRDTAVAEARNALSAFERIGADYLADQAAAFLRAIGVRGKTGPKLKRRLTEREAEVLDLIAHGMTNAEIAERLFISQKTAANHVSNVLMKLGARSRTEAAALALTRSDR